MKRSLLALVLGLMAMVVLVSMMGSCGRPRIADQQVDQRSNSNTRHSGLDLQTALSQIDAYPVPKGVSAQRWGTLVADLKKLLIARSADGKTLSIEPTGTLCKVTDLAAASNLAATQATVMWTEKLAGDCNNDGQVDIGDLQPIALHYGESSSGPGSAAYLADANGDGQVDITDLQPIAADYGMHLQGYQVWRGSYNGSTTDWETTFRPNTNPSNVNWSADRTSTPPATSRPAYTYLDDISGLTDKTNVRYKVGGFGDGAEGQESDEAAIIGGLADSAWPKFRGNAACTGLSPYVGAQTNALKWSFTAADKVEGAPSIGSDGTVYVGSDNKNVYALNPGDGSVKWSYQTSGSVVSCPAIGSDGTIYVGSEDDNIHALNPGDGSVKWSHATGGMVQSSPAIGADGTIYLGSFDNSVYALSPLDGTVKWSYATGFWVTSSPALGSDGTVYVGGFDSFVYAFNPSDGGLKWSHAPGGTLLSTPAIGQDGTIYVGCGDHSVYALNPLDGSVKWSYATGNTVGSSPAIGPDGTVYVNSSDHKIYALNPSDGSEKWAFTTTYAGTEGEGSSPAIGADGTVYVGSNDKSVYALNPADGSVKWSYATGAEVWSSAAIGADGTVYIGSNDGNLYAFGP